MREEFERSTGYQVRHAHLYSSNEVLMDTDHGSYLVGSNGARKVRLY